MTEALKQYLKSSGYENVFVDFLPDVKSQRDVIALRKWQHTVGEVNDGTGVQYVQIQARRRTREEAEAVCRELFVLLDSGIEEKILRLTQDTFCIARPRRGPLMLSRDNQQTTYYCEIALWGKN